MMDGTQALLSSTVLQMLKRKPSSFDAERWVPRLVDEIERLRECLQGAQRDRAA